MRASSCCVASARFGRMPCVVLLLALLFVTGAATPATSGVAAGAGSRSLQQSATGLAAVEEHAPDFVTPGERPVSTPGSIASALHAGAAQVRAARRPRSAGAHRAAALSAPRCPPDAPTCCRTACGADGSLSRAIIIVRRERNVLATAVAGCASAAKSAVAAAGTSASDCGSNCGSFRAAFANATSARSCVSAAAIAVSAPAASPASPTGEPAAAGCAAAAASAAISVAAGAACSARCAACVSAAAVAGRARAADAAFAG